LRITRYPAISDQQFQGCVSAFADSLTGELNSAVLALRRLEGMRKGSAFAFEMTLDTHRYGALIVLDRWGTLLRAFGPHLTDRLVDGALERIASAEEILTRANQLLDAAEGYSTDVVEACVFAFGSVQNAFDPERRSAEQSAKLGPMLSADYREARQIFLEDLAAR